jgi:ribosomal protein L16 Arg81 hydroxylase
MTQVYGRKRIRLISSHSLHLVYNYESFFSEVDCENPDFDKFPLFERAEILDVVLQPGDVLFIPVGWWHHIRSLEISINISFTNFVFNNDFEKCFIKTTDMS